MPSYNGSVPSRESTAQYDYVFSGWSPALVSVTGDAAYHAQFDKVLRKYDVSWSYNEGKQELYADQPYGAALQFADTANLDYESANYKFTFTGWVLNGDNIKTYTMEEALALTVNGDMNFVARYASEHKGYKVTVNLVLDAVLEGPGASEGRKVTVEQILGENHQLYLCTDVEGAEKIPLSYDSASQGYVAPYVHNGTYHVHADINDTHLLRYPIVVDGKDAVRNVYFWSLTYDLNGGNINGSTEDIVSYHYGRVTVAQPDPVREGYGFLGWKLDDTDTVLYNGNEVANDINRPHKLTALWGDAKVDLTVIVNHAYKNGDVTGKDPAPGGDMTVELTYRNDDSEPYVEVIGSVQTWPANEWYVDGNKNGDTTTIIKTSLYTGLDNAKEYSANVVLDDYMATKQVEYDEASRTYKVTVTLQYNPDLFNFVYSVKAPDMPAELIPAETDVKIYSYKDDLWSPISRHENYAQGVRFTELLPGAADSENRLGRASYPVPIANEDKLYYYSISAVGFTIDNGTSVPDELLATATGTDHDGKWSFSSAPLSGKYPAGAYTAVLETDYLNDAIGVYGKEENGANTQQGNVKLVLTAHPAKLKFDMQGGTPQYEDIENIFVIPELGAYTPSHEGYTFGGWYMDAQCTEAAKPGTYLELDKTTTIYAKWNPDITVAGTVTVDAVFLEHGEEHIIPRADRLSHVSVSVLDELGRTVKTVTVDLSYPANDDTAHGTAAYSITGIPNDNKTYTVTVLQGASRNYSVVYQNEPESLTDAANINAYGTGKDYNTALVGENDTTVATVNAWLDFSPVNFDLNYRIDARQIAEAFRPDRTTTVVRYDADHSEGIKWEVISQLIHSGKFEGQENLLSNGYGAYSYPVWIAHANGNLYNYDVRLQTIDYYPNGDGNKTTVRADKENGFGSTLPFAISYEPLYTYYSTGGTDGDPDQTRILNIVLTPNEYAINYETNGGTMPNTAYPTKHKWSYETDLAAACPSRPGYSFEGWYTDSGFSDASRLEKVPADRASELTLYAKWSTVSYAITYNLDGGSAENPTSYTTETETFTLNNPVREGYTFLGWTGTEVESRRDVVVIEKGSTGDRHYIAHWTPTEYTIDVTVVNGSCKQPAPVTVIHGNSITLNFEPNAGYALESAKLDGTAVHISDNSYTLKNVSSNHSIEVIFALDENDDDVPDIHQATISYAVQNGSYAQGFETTQVFMLQVYKNGIWQDANPSLGEGDFPTVLNRDLIPAEGYKDTGVWINGAITAETPVTGNATYTWRFTEIKLYTVRYHAYGTYNAGSLGYVIKNNVPHGTAISLDVNGGSNTGLVNGMEVAGQNFELTANIALNDPKREHYVFLGWQLTEESERSHVYKAMWQPEEYSITYNMPNSFYEPGKTNPTSYNVESDTIVLNNPRRSGYTFLGWTGSNGDEPDTNVSIPSGSTGDRVYTANWQAHTDTVYTVAYFFENLNAAEGEPRYLENETPRVQLRGKTDTEADIAGTKYVEEFAHFTLNEQMSKTSGTIYGDGSLILPLYYDRQRYTVTWVDYNGKELEKDEMVPYESWPSFDGAQQPSRANTDEYTYTFTGWSPELSPVSGDVTYTAQYSETKNKYTVTWKDYDGQVISQESYEYGATPSAPSPSRPSSAQYHYEFAGWDKDVVPVHANAVYTAQYKAIERYYTGTLKLFVDAAAASAEQIAAILDGKSFYFGSVPATENAAVEYTELSGENGVLTAQLKHGEYRLYTGDGSNFSPVGGLYLRINGADAAERLDYNTVVYKDDYSDSSVIRTEYYQQGSTVHVGEKTARDGWYFKGWQDETSNKLYQHNDLLSASINTRYVLVAQWSNAKVNLTVVLNHKYSEGVTTGIDHAGGGIINVDLVYKEKNGDTYYEVVGSAEVSKGYIRSQNEDITTVYLGDIFTALDDSYDYSTNVFVEHYVKESTDIRFDDGSDTYNVTVTMQYNPALFKLDYTVKVDESVADSLVPAAADIKIYYKDDTGWSPISSHEHSSVDVVLGADREGSGSYNVPYMIGKDVAYYRIGAAGLTLKDAAGNNVELGATGSVAEKEFFSTAGGKYPPRAYTAKLSFDAANEDHDGAHGNQIQGGYEQKGSLILTIYAHPAKVIFNANADGSKVTNMPEAVENTFSIPELSSLPVPQRQDYTFLGWYRDKECETAASSGTMLEPGTPVTLYAKWAKNLTVLGDITAFNTYGVDSNLIEGDRLKSLNIALFKAGPERAQIAPSITVNLKPGDKINTGEYTFENVPNDGSEYYIVVSAPGFSVTFMNEKREKSSIAVDVNGDSNARVDVELRFAPQNFDLSYQLDASQLGTGFRPNSAQVYVLGDIDHGSDFKWEVISQMREGNTPVPLKAQQTVIDESSGIGNNTYPVWQTHPHGHPYNYAIRIAAMEVDLNCDGSIQDDEKLEVPYDKLFREFYPNLPFRVHYDYPAFFENGTQQGTVKATLIPDSFTVSLDANGGNLTIDGVNLSSFSHTWSIKDEKNFAISRDGWYFDGWEILTADISENDVKTDADSITVAPGVQQDVSLRAKWTKIESVSFTAMDSYTDYTGQKRTFTPVILSDLPKGYSFSGLSYTISGTNAGTYDESNGRFAIAEGGIRIFDTERNDVTNYYDVANAQTTGGKLTINRLPLTVVAEDKSKTYDGKVFENEFTYRLEGFVSNETPETAVEIYVSFGGDAVTGINAGSYTIRPVVDSYSSKNYFINTIEHGTLTISPKTVTVTLDASDKDYDGTTAAGVYSLTVSGLAEGETLSARAESVFFDDEDVKRAADGSVQRRTVTAQGVELVGNDMGNYQLDSACATLTYEAAIKPLTVTAWLIPVSRSYDGSNVVRIGAGEVIGLLESDTVTVTNYPATGTMENAAVGKDKTVTVDKQLAFAGVHPKSVNYNLETKLATVDITKRSVILVSATADKAYDGTALTAPEVTVGGEGFVSGEISALIATGSVIGAKDSNTSATNTISYTGAESFDESNYSIEKREGILTVHADKNENGIPDDSEKKYTVLYLRAEHTDLDKDVFHEELLTGMPIPAAPTVVADNGYQLGQWVLEPGYTEGAGSTIGLGNLVYKLEVEPCEYNITYVLGTEEELDNPNPAKYTFGVGVESFSPIVRPGYSFQGWYEDAQLRTAITSVAADRSGDITLYAKFVVDNKNVAYLDAELLYENQPQPNSKVVQAGKTIRVIPNGGIWNGSSEDQDIVVTTDIDLGVPTRSGYVFRGWKCTAGTGTSLVYIYTAQWEADNNGDGIPDRFQKQVIFKIKNGYWTPSVLRAALGFATSDDLVYYLTLEDEDGNWSETGTAWLKPYVPTGMTARRGYHNGAWLVTPPDYVSGTEPVEYVYRFVAKPGTAPKTGDDSNIGLWGLLMGLSMAAVVGTAFGLKKAKRKEK